MSAIIDDEVLLLKVTEILQNKLTAKINAINTEKGDTLLTPIDNNAYFYAPLPESWPNFDPFLLLTSDVASTNSVNSDTGREVMMTINLLTQLANDGNNTFRLLRYRRAIREVMEENNELEGLVNRSEITDLPALGVSTNSGESLQTIGISVTVQYA